MPKNFCTVILVYDKIIHLLLSELTTCPGPALGQTDKSE